MKDIAALLGLEASEQEPMVAVLRCHGSRENAPPKVQYEGAMTCAFAHNLFSGEGGCPYGCLGCGDCVEACPRSIIEMRKKGKKSRRIYVSCINREKGGPARKNCAVACIGCGKCVKECKFDAITLENNLAYIDFEKCTLCRKCPPVCPTSAIAELNFPPRKVKPQTQETPAGA